MRAIVPDEILDRKDKIGFATPEASWLREMQPWIEHILISDTARAIPAIDHKAMRMEWQRFLNGQAHFDFRFWRWVNFIRWVERRGIVFD
jgi:asparagine synthase (glutamine-hydrolysing)